MKSYLGGSLQQMAQNSVKERRPQLYDPALEIGHFRIPLEVHGRASDPASLKKQVWTDVCSRRPKGAMPVARGSRAYSERHPGDEVSRENSAPVRAR